MNNFFVRRDSALMLLHKIDYAISNVFVLIKLNSNFSKEERKMLTILIIIDLDVPFEWGLKIGKIFHFSLQNINLLEVWSRCNNPKGILKKKKIPEIVFICINFVRMLLQNADNAILKTLVRTKLVDGFLKEKLNNFDHFNSLDSIFFEIPLFVMIWYEYAFGNSIIQFWLRSYI